ncbi:MAG: hypothetical protein ACJ786_13780 [Catenulispora sp.]
MFSITAPSWFTLISPFLGTRWEPGFTPVLPALGQPVLGGLAAAAGAGVGDVVLALEGVFDGEGVADFAGVVGVDTGAEVDVAFGIEAEVDVSAVAGVGRGEVAAAEAAE